MTNQSIPYIFGALVLLFILYYTFQAGKSKAQNDGSAPASDAEQDHGAECCGKHAVCEKQKLAQARMREAQYFDDEELDRYRSRRSDDYLDQEVDEFRYVLYTMKPDEVRTWMECLQAREIEIPDQLKEEAWSMMNEN